MTLRRLSFGLIAMLLTTANCPADDELAAKLQNLQQQMLSFPIVVLDDTGDPVPNATVSPWALRSSQGHGSWSGKELPLPEPPKLRTDATGGCVVPYPRYANADELVRTSKVTLSIDHPDFVYECYQEAEVPRDDLPPYIVRLKRGARVEVTPVRDGAPASTEGLHLLASDYRWWPSLGTPPDRTKQSITMPPMPAGMAQVMLVRIADGRATEFSKIASPVLVPGDTRRIELELSPSVQVRGSVSENVPRPVRRGRISVRTIPQPGAIGDGVAWTSWAPIAADGSFVIEAWPAGESMQAIALADGWIAASGLPLGDIATPEQAGMLRPQVFHAKDLGEPVTLEMVPLAKCEFEAIDDRGRPCPGVKIRSWPNVHWWEGGSQIYCDSLVRMECAIESGSYELCANTEYSNPFETVTDDDGRGVMELPAGEGRFVADSDVFEIPIREGNHYARQRVVAGESNRVRITLQPKGTEKLGDWDHLADVLFNLHAAESRKLLKEPGFREKLDAIAGELDKLANSDEDAAMLQPAFRGVAAAYKELGAADETAKWRRRAEEVEDGETPSAE